MKPSNLQETKKTKGSQKKTEKKPSNSLFFSIVIPILSLLVGAIPLWLYFHPTESEIMNALKQNGKYQKLIEKKEYVKSFKECLIKITEKEYEYVWNNMLATERKKGKYSDNFDIFCSIHLLTAGYNFEYFIPIKEEEDEVKFWVLFKFEDNIDIGEVAETKKNRQKKIGELNAPLTNEFLIKEVYQILKTRYVMEKDSTSYFKEIKKHINDLSLQEYVRYGWYYPMYVANKMNLKVKDSKEVETKGSFEYLAALVWSEVIMKKENGVWKLNTFRTLALEPWQ